MTNSYSSHWAKAAKQDKYMKDNNKIRNIADDDDKFNTTEKKRHNI